MKQAVLIYHAVNILHLGMYALIFCGLMNFFELGNFLSTNVKEILIIYALIYVGLNFIARSISKGLMNPIITNKLANWLHVGSIIIFAASFYLYHNTGKEYVYLMMVSFPMDIFAVVLAFREISLKDKKSQSIDDSFLK